MIVVVVPYCVKDRLLAVELLRWIADLEQGKKWPEIVLVSSKPISKSEDQEVIDAAKLGFNSVTMAKQAVECEMGWPQSPNELFRLANEVVRHQPYPWLWLEPDATPTRAGWLDALDQEYRRVGKPFFGSTPSNPIPHLTGIAIYPPDVRKYAPEIIKPNVNPFDCQGSEVCNKILRVAHNSPLMQHEWGCDPNDKSPFPKTRTFDESLEGLNPEALIFHRCKDGSLIRELRKALSGPTVESNEPYPITVVVTTYQRPLGLRNAVESCKAAGVKNVVISSCCDDRATQKLCSEYTKATWANIRHVTNNRDASGNRSWLRGVNACQTEWVTILHDDDLLLPSFRTIPGILKRLDGSADFFCWAGGNHFFRDDGSIENRNYNHDPIEGETPGLLRVSRLWPYLLKRDNLAISPVAGLFKRDHLIASLEEVSDLLVTDDFFTRPSMMVGNDLWIWLNAVENGEFFYYSKIPMISYGHWNGSISYDDAVNKRGELRRIYNATRSMFLDGPPFVMEASPQLVHVQSVFESKGDALKREQYAKAVWKQQYKRGNWVSLEISDSDLPRIFQDPTRKVPYLKDILDRAVSYTQANIEPDAIFVLTNTDSIPVRSLTRQIINCFADRNCCYSFRKDIPTFGLYDEVRIRLEGQLYSGVDLIAFKAEWWRKHRSAFPDMLYAAEAWDYLMQLFINERGGKAFEHLIYHVRHTPEGIWNLGNPSMLHNRGLIEPFLKERGLEIYWEKREPVDEKSSSYHKQRKLLPRHY